MNETKIKSNAKINLSLYVLGKKNSNFHRIESLIVFIDLHDEINVKNSKKKNHTIQFHGKFSSEIPKKNSVSILLKYLDSRNLLKGKKYSFIIKKNIPQKSGMGGGSMNAATILKYFLKKKILKLKRREREKIANFIGSDVKIGLENDTLLLKSNGKIQRKIKIKKLHLLVVKPNLLGCSTKTIYAGIKTYSKLSFNKRNNFNLQNLKLLRNDLEPIAIKKYPSLLKLKKALKNLPNVKFVRMTGSGSTFVAFFVSKKAGINAAKVFKSKFNNYWITISKTI